MTHVFTRRVGVCALAAVVTVAPTAPGFAAERAATASSPSTLLASGQKQVQQLAMTTPPAPARAAAQPGAGSGGYDDAGSFFRTPRGVAILVLAAAGIGYMWYSKVHDRIHSVARERFGE